MDDDDYTDAAEPGLWPIYLAIVIFLYALWRTL